MKQFLPAICICLIFVTACGGNDEATVDVPSNTVGDTGDTVSEVNNEEIHDDALDEPDTKPTENFEAGECFVVKIVTCGEKVSGSTQNKKPQIDTYGCGFDGEDYGPSPEATYLFAPTANTAAKITLTEDKTASQSTDIFILGESPGERCDPTNCDYGEDSLSLDVEAGKHYYITLDNYLGLAGDFTLEVDCCLPDCEGKDCGSDGCGGTCGECMEGQLCDFGGTQSCGTQTCTAVKALNCGDSLSDVALDGEGSTNSLGSSGCNSLDYSGPEMTYSFVTDKALRLTALLPKYDSLEDLDVHILKDDGNGICDAMNCEATGLNEASIITEPGTTYYIVVDGFEGNTSAFNLSLDCCIPSCEAKNCGDDGCGGTCGDCGLDGLCQENQCITPKFLNNDTCNSAINISKLPYESVGTTLGAKDDYTPPSSCISTRENGTGVDTIYSYTATQNTAIHGWLDDVPDPPECPESCTPKIFWVSEGCPNGEGKCLKGIDYFENPGPTIWLNAQKGKTYYFVVDGFNEGEAGPYVFHLAEAGCNGADVETGTQEDAEVALNAIGCVQSCIGLEDAKCSVDCIAEIGFSKSCSTCIDELVNCGLQNCFDSCSSNPTDSECAECLNEQACLSTFTQCSGLAGDFFSGKVAGKGIDGNKFTKIACPEGLAIIAETEPNDLAADAQSLKEQGAPGFCIQGGALCGNNGGDYTYDTDFFTFTPPSNGNATLGLQWESAADMDFYLTTGNEELISYEDGIATSESGDAALNAGTQYSLNVSCWSGDDGAWTLWVKWD